MIMYQSRKVIPGLGGLGLAALGLFALPSLVSGDEHRSETAVFHTHDDAALEWGPCPEFLPEGCGLAVLHGDPEGSNADVFLRVPPGSDLAHHWHTSAERMILVSGELHLDYDGQDMQIATPGTYIYGPARLPHSGHCAAGDVPCVLFIAFEGPVDAIPTDERTP